MQKLFLAKFWYGLRCVSVILRPSEYLVSPHFALGAIWVSDPDLHFVPSSTAECIYSALPKSRSISFSCSSRSARAFSYMPAVFQKLFDCVSGVKWLKSAFLRIHWLLCEELGHSLAFCAFFRSVEPVLKFQALAPGI